MLCHSILTNYFLDLFQCEYMCSKRKTRIEVIFSVIFRDVRRKMFVFFCRLNRTTAHFRIMIYMNKSKSKIERKAHTRDKWIDIEKRNCVSTRRRSFILFPFLLLSEAYIFLCWLAQFIADLVDKQSIESATKPFYLRIIRTLTSIANYINFSTCKQYVRIIFFIIVRWLVY